MDAIYQTILRKLLPDMNEDRCGVFQKALLNAQDSKDFFFTLIH